MAAKSKRTTYEEIYRRHIRLYRELNDLHIFATRTSPLLKAAADEHKGEFIDPDEDIELSVPGKHGRPGIARRNSTELSALLKRFANEELYANLLVTAVSRFEFYLADVLGEFLRRDPEKLLRGPKGGDSGRPVPLQMVVDADDLEDLYEGLIEQRIQSIFYAEPKEYCAYFNTISELEIPEKSFEQFFEIKATRDLIVHNSLLVNELYRKKAGALARGELGDRLKVKEDYFETCLSAMKKLSGTIEKRTQEKHGKKGKP
ncbi:hypothetical protein O3299_19840 [Janthinobacterium sp. SUN176]|uniref:hypothetical protein n=1 Tax=Janthinobacterium sp. SUN176 TaxID=3014788 RepID=UPI0027128F88|nr:hypothetical protein [Janthinobacterium sp. SUN176]MDO8073791.1 hypothetical protein [Janthinobacterium sp. SUN176]